MTASLRLRLPLEQYHQYQALTNDCAPFTTAIVANTLTGKNLQGLELAEEMNRPRLAPGPIPYPVIRRIPNWATFPWGIADELRRQGVAARWRFGAQEADLRGALEENRVAMPIIGELMRWRDGRLRLWAHVKPLFAFDPAQGWAFVDPASARPVTWQGPAEFADLWRSYGHLLVETIQ